MPETFVETPVGPLCVVQDGDAITALDWRRGAQDRSAVLDQAHAQLLAYFVGELTVFDLPLQVEASPFVQSVCQEMQAIPFGETVTYGDIAKSLSCAAQPVGRACGANPIPVIIPCHRVMGANGKLTGFSGMGGVETKVALLRHEGAASLLI